MSSDHPIDLDGLGDRLLAIKHAGADHVLTRDALLRGEIEKVQRMTHKAGAQGLPLAVIRTLAIEAGIVHVGHPWDLRVVACQLLALVMSARSGTPIESVLAEHEEKPDAS